MEGRFNGPRAMGASSCGCGSVQEDSSCTVAQVPGLCRTGLLSLVPSYPLRWIPLGEEHLVRKLWSSTWPFSCPLSLLQVAPPPVFAGPSLPASRTKEIRFEI